MKIYYTILICCFCFFSKHILANETMFMNLYNQKNELIISNEMLKRKNVELIELRDKLKKKKKILAGFAIVSNAGAVSTLTTGIITNINKNKLNTSIKDAKKKVVSAKAKNPDIPDEENTDDEETESTEYTFEQEDGFIIPYKNGEKIELKNYKDNKIYLVEELEKNQYKSQMGDIVSFEKNNIKIVFNLRNNFYLKRSHDKYNLYYEVIKKVKREIKFRNLKLLKENIDFEKLNQKTYRRGVIIHDPFNLKTTGNSPYGIGVYTKTEGILIFEADTNKQGCLNETHPDLKGKKIVEYKKTKRSRQFEVKFKNDNSWHLIKL